MRDFVIIIACLIMSVVASAQTKPIKFMGVPVEGTLDYFVSKLEKKTILAEFGDNNDDDSVLYAGLYNNKAVLLSPLVLDNEVYGVGIMYSIESSSQETKLEYNRIYRQFTNSDRYKIVYGSLIDDNDFITYDRVANKEFGSIFKPLEN